jgi:DnaJ-class molecular chaperone
MKMDSYITEALCGFNKLVTTLYNRSLVDQTIPGEFIQTGDLKCMFGEGMPTHHNPFEKCKFITQLLVQFQDSLSPQTCAKLKSLLPPKEEHMIPEEHKVVNMNDFNPEEDQSQQTISKDN